MPEESTLRLPFNLAGIINGTQDSKKVHQVLLEFSDNLMRAYGAQNCNVDNTNRVVTAQWFFTSQTKDRDSKYQSYERVAEFRRERDACFNDPYFQQLFLPIEHEREFPQSQWAAVKHLYERGVKLQACKRMNDSLFEWYDEERHPAQFLCQNHEGFRTMEIRMHEDLTFLIPMYDKLLDYKLNGGVLV